MARLIISMDLPTRFEALVRERARADLVEAKRELRHLPDERAAGPAGAAAATGPE